MNKSFSITFILRRDKIDNNELIPIYIRITINGEKIEISSKRKIHSEDWDIKANSPKGKSDTIKNLLKFLESQKLHAYDVYSELLINKERLTIQNYKTRFLNLNVSENTILQITAKHNDEFFKSVGSKYSLGSYKNYKTTFKYLQDFIKYIYRRNDLNINDIDYLFAEKYFNYLLEFKPCNHNGAIKHIQRLKKIINYSIHIGILNLNPINSFKQSFLPYNRDILCWEDLSKLIQVTNITPRQRKVLDCFLIQCFSGLSYIDIKNLKIENIKTINEKKWIIIYRQKTKIRSAIPVMPQIESIITKYIDRSKNVLLPVISNQKMNETLKEIASITGIEINLSTHVARHTFATTVALENGVPIETISKMLGHTNLKTTQIYAKVLDSKIDFDMSNLIKKLKNK